MEIPRKILAVIDPSTDQQRALSRAAQIGKARSIPLHAYLGTYSHAGQRADDPEALRRAEVARHELWLASVVAPWREQGVEIDTEVEWTEDWREAMARAAARTDCGLIVKASNRRSDVRRRIFKTSDWTLLRTAQCPVLLVKSDAETFSGKVLAALDARADDEVHQRLNDAIVDYSKTVAAAQGVELHVVNAYDGSMRFVHPPDLAGRMGIPRAHAHVADGPPEKIIPGVAADIGAGLLVMGSVARSGVAGGVIGNTAEKILDQIDADILVIIAREPR
jgi:universal stress protein E